MSWDKDESLERIKRRWEARDVEISVSKLTRDMNLENVTLHNGRLIHGAHLYVTVAGSGELHCLDTDEHASSAIQRVALWQAEVARMAKAFDVPIIAFQGARVHLLTYRPIDDDAAISRKAALLARAITYMTREAFNPLFEEERRLNARAATDLGETVATRGGTRGDSELLFLGSAANRPAKLRGSSKLVVSGRFMDAFGDQLEHERIESGDEDAYILRIPLSAVEDAVDQDGIAWSVQTSTDRLKEELEKWPLDRFKTSGATSRIDPTALSRTNSKLVPAAVILMDLDGFSAYVDQAENDSVKRDAILTLDAIRQEMREVLKVDFSGVRIQYQGDNMIGVVHLPNGMTDKIAAAAAEVAAGMQASMAITLPQVVPHTGSLDVAVGVALDDTVLACLGEYGRRNALVIGHSPTEAEAIQLRLEGKETGIDKAVYDALPEDIQGLYHWQSRAKAYVATDLTSSKLARVREALASEGERELASDGAGRFYIGSTPAATERKRVRPFRPYHP